MWLRPVVRSCLVAVAVVLAAAATLALVRLLPWWLDPRVPGRAAWVFARGLGSVALAVSAALGLPLGVALAAARLSERGERVALLATGRSPAALALRAAAIPVAFAALISGSASLLGLRGDGLQTAGDLVTAARAACRPEVPVVSIPGTPAAFVQRDGRPTFAVATTGAALFGEDVTLQKDGAVVRSAELLLRGPPEVRVRVGEARVIGVDLPGHPAGVPTTRALLASGAAAAVLSALLFFAIFRRGEDRLVVAVALSIVAAAPALVLLRIA